MTDLKVSKREALKEEFERRLDLINDSIPSKYVSSILKKHPYLPESRIINVRNKRCIDFYILSIFEKTFKKKK